MKLVKGTEFLRRHFDKSSRLTKAELIELIDAGELPGKILGGKPFVDENRWLGAGPRFKDTVHKPSGVGLLT